MKKLMLISIEIIDRCHLSLWTEFDDRRMMLCLFIVLMESCIRWFAILVAVGGVAFEGFGV